MEIDVYGREEFACIWALAVRMLPEGEEITTSVMREAFGEALRIYLKFHTSMTDPGGAVTVEATTGVITAHFAGGHLVVTAAKGAVE